MSQELVEKVFQPGNLVHGARLDDLPSLIHEGIRPGMLYGRMSFAPTEICFGMLPVMSLPKRYQCYSLHDGPLEDNGPSRDKAGIIVSKEKLMAAFPKEVLAVGEYFWSEEEEWGRQQLFPGLIEQNSILGIPIKSHWRKYLYPTEVVLSPKQWGEAAVGIELWQGLVLTTNAFLYLNPFSLKKIREFKIPVFSPNCELMEEDLIQD